MNYAKLSEKNTVLYVFFSENEVAPDSSVVAVPEWGNDDITGLINSYYYYVDEWRPIPTPPINDLRWCYFDGRSEAWVIDLDAAKAAKKADIESGLTNRLYLPCNGFDADKVSRERISGMIARLQRGDGLPAGWVGWRDASNQQQWVTDDAATVLANLTALSRAIEDREQALLVASWTHKANIAALTDIDTILAYDTTAGW